MEEHEGKEGGEEGVSFLSVGYSVMHRSDNVLVLLMMLML